MITAASYPLQYNKTKTILFNFNNTIPEVNFSVYSISVDIIIPYLFVFRFHNAQDSTMSRQQTAMLSY